MRMLRRGAAMLVTLAALGAAVAAAETSVTARAASSATVSARGTALGRVLTNGAGDTLYLFVKDHSGHSACSGACANVWPPLLTSGSPRAGSGVARSKLGTISRGGGKRQVTYAGHPLYRYVADGAPGQTKGEGLNSFGARWYAVSPSGASVTR